MMSAFHPIATEQQTQFYVGFVPIADIAQTERTDRVTKSLPSPTSSPAPLQTPPWNFCSKRMIGEEKSQVGAPDPEAALKQ